MAPSHLHQPVLAANPAANVDALINGLLDELRQCIDEQRRCIDELPIAPGQTVQIDSAKLLALRGTFFTLRGVFMDMSGTVRNRLRWAK